MKLYKHVSIFLATLLLVSNMGLAFNVHYCGGQISSISLKTVAYSDKSEKNCCGVTEKESHCCKNKVFQIQKKWDNTIAKTVAFQPNFDFLIQEYHSIIDLKKASFKEYKITSYTCNANAPPLFTKNCQLLFYA